MSSLILIILPLMSHLFQVCFYVKFVLLKVSYSQKYILYFELYKGLSNQAINSIYRLNQHTQSKNRTLQSLDSHFTFVNNLSFAQKSMQPLSPPLNSNLQQQNTSLNSSGGLSIKEESEQSPMSETDLSSINIFLNSYQKLKKFQDVVIDIKPYCEKNAISQPSNSNYLVHSHSFGNGSTAMLAKEATCNHLKKKQDNVAELVVSRQQLAFTSVQQIVLPLTLPALKLPSDNSFTVINSNIKCASLLSRVRFLDNGEDINKRPMFTYPQWKQLSQGVKKIFNKAFQTPMKELNTGTLIPIKPNQSLGIRTDYYCFYPHQVYTTLLALDKSDISSGTLAFCCLNKQFIQTEFSKYNDQSQLLDSINKNRKQVEWEYLNIKQANLIILGRDVIYGSFRNDSPTTKFFAEMRWVRHQSASNSSNSS